MVVARNKESSQWWWLDSTHNKGNSNRTPWLQYTLAELDEKTKTMLKLIEEDADSFAQRAEMYYKKRPQLIGMVEDFYRTHRSLAERYDQAKSEHGITARLQAPFSSPLSFTKYRLDNKSLSLSDKAYDSYSENYGPDESSDESEVDDPEEEEEEEEVTSQNKVIDPENEQLVRLRKEIEMLREENEVQKEQLMQKDEEKREVIRQLSLAMELLREENVKLRRSVVKISITPKKENTQESFIGRFFAGFGKSPANLVAV